MFCFQVEECEQVHDSDPGDRDTPRLDHLLNLDISADTLPVTVITIRSTDNDSDICLYGLVAGGLSSSIEYSCEQWAVATTKLRNDKLHVKIQASCQKHLRDKLKLDPAKLELFEVNTPSFVVTENLPDDEEDPVSVEPTVLEKDGKKSYRYSHQTDRDIFMTVFEPESPSKIRVGTPSSAQDVHQTHMVRNFLLSLMAGCCSVEIDQFSSQSRPIFTMPSSYLIIFPPPSPIILPSRYPTSIFSNQAIFQPG